jgi:hypothetical protein
VGAAVMLEGVKAPAQRASLARLTAALVCVLAAAVGMLVATPTPAMAATYAYDTVSYTYDAPARLSSSDTVATEARGSPSGPGATSWETSVSVAGDVVAANTGGRLGDEVVLVRGGTNTAERFASGSGVTSDAAGNLSGVSVNSGRTIEEAAQGIRNNQVGVSTVGDVRRAGGTVIRDPLPDNPSHCLMGGCTADDFSRLFTPTIKNPWK